MKTKAYRKLKLLLFFSWLILLVMLVYVSLSTKNQGYLIAIPKISANTPIESLEEINEDKTMLTYENIYEKQVVGVQSNFQIILKGTNYTYPYVMGYRMLSGGFFSKEAAEGKNKVVVLNKKAAFDIFGTIEAIGNELQIDNVLYIVSGVIEDSDENNLNAFVPATIFSDSVGDILVNLSVNGLSEEATKNELKHIGVSELNYNFLNLGLITEATKNKIPVSIGVVVFGFVLVILKKLIRVIISKAREIRQYQQQFYFGELLKIWFGPVQKFILLSVISLCMIAFEFLLALKIFEHILTWNNLKGVFNTLSYSGFATNIAHVETAYILSNILFIGFVVIFSINIIEV